jgi:Ca2+-dependent lipid-binding protein
MVQVKTRVLRKTVNPVFDETFTFYGIDENQLSSITLHFVVLSFDRFSRDDVIGEVVYQLDEFDPCSSTKSVLTLCRQITHRQNQVTMVTVLY